MYKTTKILQTKHNHEVDLSILRAMCYHAARLYNVGLYSVRQHFFNTDTYLTYNSNYHECKNNENFKLLLSDCGQQILKKYTFLTIKNKRQLWSAQYRAGLAEYRKMALLPSDSQKNSEKNIMYLNAEYYSQYRKISDI